MFPFSSVGCDFPQRSNPAVLLSARGCFGVASCHSSGAKGRRCRQSSVAGETWLRCLPGRQLPMPFPLRPVNGVISSRVLGCSGHEARRAGAEREGEESVFVRSGCGQWQRRSGAAAGTGCRVKRPSLPLLLAEAAAGTVGLVLSVQRCGVEAGQGGKPLPKTEPPPPSFEGA